MQRADVIPVALFAEELKSLDPVRGDIVHVCPVEFADSSVAITYDIDSKRSVQERERRFCTFQRHSRLIAVLHMTFLDWPHSRRRGRLPMATDRLR